MMPAGLFIVLAAVALLCGNVTQNLFVAAGMGVEILGLFLVTRSHLPGKRRKE